MTNTTTNTPPNIIVIDDEELTQELIRHMLREIRTGDVVVYSSCGKALTRVRQNPKKYNLIISDWEVPGLNGLEFLKEIRKIDPDIPFLMVTGHSSKNLVVDAIKAGVNDFLAKPFSAKGLLEKVIKLTGTGKKSDI
jgi:two-component system, chemotaxis family, chemotaxis protein CheY